MKKFFIMLSIMGMMLVLAACGETRGTDAQKKSDAVSEDAEIASSDNIGTTSVSEIDDKEADDEQKRVENPGDSDTAREETDNFVDSLEEGDSVGESADIQAENESTESADSIRPEFKETMDSYEAFFDGYVDFMNKYNSSEDAMSMLADYLKIIEQYTETMEYLSEIDESELTIAETLYYTEVMTRINTKLLEIAE